MLEQEVRKDSDIRDDYVGFLPPNPINSMERSQSVEDFKRTRRQYSQ